MNKEKQEWTRRNDKVYEKEGVLQDYLARYSDLLPGDQIDPEKPRRWLPVNREMSVPGEANTIDS